MKIYRQIENVQVEIYDLVINDQAQYQGRLMAEDKIVCPVTVSDHLDLQISDYIILNGSKYYMNRPPNLDEMSDVEFRYNITFEGEIYSMLNLIFKDSIDSKTKWEKYGNLEFFVDKILAHFTGWTKGEIKTTESKVISFQSITCREALNKLAAEFNCEFLIVGKHITFVSKIENPTGLTFERGKNKGLYSLAKQNVDDGNTVTRIIPFGSNRNLTFSYGSDRLTVAPIEDLSNYPILVEKEVEFPDIYPQFIGGVSIVSEDFLSIGCDQIDFDINNQLISGMTAKIVFLDGQLSGNAFEILKPYDNTNKKITFKAITVNDQILPSTIWKPQIGDVFTLIDMNMPEIYLRGGENSAETRLTNAATEWLSYYSKLRIKYTLTLDPRYLRNIGASINIGDLVTITGGVELRIISIQYPLLYPTRITAEISNYRDEFYENKLSTKINYTLQLIDKAKLDAAASTELLNHLWYDPTTKQITSDGSLNIGGRLNVAAKIISIKLSSDVVTAHPTWMLVSKSSSINQLGSTYSIKFGPLINTSNGSNVTASFDVYAKLNTGEFISCDNPVSFSGTGVDVTISGVLPFIITWNDVVYFELQYF